MRRGIRILLGFFFFVLLGCAARKPPTQPLSPRPLSYVQFGSRLFFSGNLPQGIKGIQRVERVSGGVLVEPQGRCLQVNKGSICLKSVPPVRPHLQVLRIDSAGVDLKILSLFPRIALFWWMEGERPDLSHPHLYSPGIYTLKDFSLGKVYFLSGAVVWDKKIYGPFTEPLRLRIEDSEPPLSPPGGGYLVQDGKITLIWEPSPSRDVKDYVVEREGKTFRVKGTSFEEEIPPGKLVVYNIKARDKAGNESPPLRIRVNLSGGK